MRAKYSFPETSVQGVRPQANLLRELHRALLRKAGTSFSLSRREREVDVPFARNSGSPSGDSKSRPIPLSWTLISGKLY
jgi:hypothetical protein